MNRSLTNSFSTLILSLSLAACTGATEELANLTLGTPTVPTDVTDTGTDTSVDTSTDTGTNIDVVRNTSCTDLYYSNFALVEGLDGSPIQVFAKPEKGVSALDPTYGSCMTRVTDHVNEPPSGFARNDYSRRQAFNADESKILVYALDGFWHLYDATSYQYIKKLNLGGSDVEPQWSPSEPDVLFKFPMNGGMTIQKYNVVTDQSTTVTDFRNVTSIYGHPGSTDIRDIWPTAARIWTKSEGSPSKDARYWGLQVETSSFGILGMITYDMQTNTITGVYDLTGKPRPDHISMSPTGDYVIPSWYSDFNSCNSTPTSNPCGLMSYTRDFSQAVRLAATGEHSDIALDSAGNDVVVMSNYRTGYVEAYDVATGQVTNLWNMYVNGSATALHVSGKAYNKPGWVLISTYATSGGTRWYTNKIMAVEIAANPRILNISHTYHKDKGYWTEPHAVVNRDFTRILFNSNWHEDTDKVDAYMIDLPMNALD
jgi:hypothetical protein